MQKNSIQLEKEKSKEERDNKKYLWNNLFKLL